MYLDGPTRASLSRGVAFSLYLRSLQPQGKLVLIPQLWVPPASPPAQSSLHTHSLWHFFQLAISLCSSMSWAHFPQNISPHIPPTPAQSHQPNSSGSQILNSSEDDWLKIIPKATQPPPAQTAPRNILSRTRSHYVKKNAAELYWVKESHTGTYKG